MAAASAGSPRSLTRPGAASRTSPAPPSPPGPPWTRTTPVRSGNTTADHFLVPISERHAVQRAGSPGSLTPRGPRSKEQPGSRRERRSPSRAAHGRSDRTCTRRQARRLVPRLGRLAASCRARLRVAMRAHPAARAVEDGSMTPVCHDERATCSASRGSRPPRPWRRRRLRRRRRTRWTRLPGRFGRPSLTSLTTLRAASTRGASLAGSRASWARAAASGCEPGEERQGGGGTANAWHAGLLGSGASSRSA